MIIIAKKADFRLIPKIETGKECFWIRAFGLMLFVVFKRGGENAKAI